MQRVVSTTIPPVRAQSIRILFERRLFSLLQRCNFIARSTPKPQTRNPKPLTSSALRTASLDDIRAISHAFLLQLGMAPPRPISPLPPARCPLLLFDVLPGSMHRSVSWSFCALLFVANFGLQHQAGCTNSNCRYKCIKLP